MLACHELTTTFCYNPRNWIRLTCKFRKLRNEWFLRNVFWSFRIVREGFSTAEVPTHVLDRYCYKQRSCNFPKRRMASSKCNLPFVKSVADPQVLHFFSALSAGPYLLESILFAHQTKNSSKTFAAWFFIVWIVNMAMYRRLPKYDREWHPKLCNELFCSSREQSIICRKHMIGKSQYFPTRVSSI